ncbi:unnamed protein product [Didymodactylos carnosus]|uniref:Uncharacterized protein n=1 Tax=Didymodactylos carnosus TaxID=1234261 RepID=A0A815Q598_9BILA|nr:unnamed protein product [Didymodactylos carnosus]CAF4329053.1 unnamed protein product [Didymodactylos carnosus]
MEYRTINFNIHKFIKADDTLSNKEIIKQLVDNVEQILYAFDEKCQRAFISKEIETKLRTLVRAKIKYYNKNKRSKANSWPRTTISIRIPVEKRQHRQFLTPPSCSSSTKITFSWKDESFMHRFDPGTEESLDTDNDAALNGSEEGKNKDISTTFEEKLMQMDCQLTTSYVRVRLPAAILQYIFLKENELVTYRLNVQSWRVPNISMDYSSDNKNDPYDYDMESVIDDSDDNNSSAVDQLYLKVEIHSTFDYVDKANWDYARINWLSKTKRLDQTGTKQSYTFHGSVDQNVFNFVKEIQRNKTVSECHPPAKTPNCCPKPMRSSETTEISLEYLYLRGGPSHPKKCAFKLCQFEEDT